MSVLSYQTIKTLCAVHKMLEPWHERTVANGKTFGLSAAGYDIRVAETHAPLFAGQFVLASSMERFKMPNDVIAFVNDKSSWARKGLAVQNTVIEPGWEGYLTIELSNHGDDILHIAKGDPIAQIIFHRLDYPTVAPYKGKYQNQEAGPQPYRHEE